VTETTHYALVYELPTSHEGLVNDGYTMGKRQLNFEFRGTGIESPFYIFDVIRVRHSTVRAHVVDFSRTDLLSCENGVRFEQQVS
jgi:hypothetical protein